LLECQCLAVAFEESPNPEHVDLHPVIVHKINGILNSCWVLFGLLD
jgi:hypothetical protein